MYSHEYITEQLSSVESSTCADNVAVDVRVVDLDSSGTARNSGSVSNFAHSGMVLKNMYQPTFPKHWTSRTTVAPGGMSGVLSFEYVKTGLFVLSVWSS